MITIPRGAICLVTDRRRLAPAARTTEDELSALEGLVDEAVAAGVDLIQIREPDLDAGTLCRLVARVMGRAGARASCILVNDRADVALAAGADGVHLRADSPAASRVRSLSPSWMLGRSVHEGDRPAAHSDVDYLLFGPVFSTASKPGVAPAGLVALAAFVEASAVPVLAIGGIDAGRGAECCRRGARGVAGISIFLPEGCAPEALGPSRAVRELRAAMLGVC